MPGKKSQKNVRGTKARHNKKLKELTKNEELWLRTCVESQ